MNDLIIAPFLSLQNNMLLLTYSVPPCIMDLDTVSRLGHSQFIGSAYSILCMGNALGLVEGWPDKKNSAQCPNLRPTMVYSVSNVSCIYFPILYQKCFKSLAQSYVKYSTHKMCAIFLVWKTSWVVMPSYFTRHHPDLMLFTGHNTVLHRVQ